MCSQPLPRREAAGALHGHGRSGTPGARIKVRSLAVRVSPLSSWQHPRHARVLSIIVQQSAFVTWVRLLKVCNIVALINDDRLLVIIVQRSCRGGRGDAQRKARVHKVLQLHTGITQLR